MNIVTNIHANFRVIRKALYDIYSNANWELVERPKYIRSEQRKYEKIPEYLRGDVESELFDYFVFEDEYYRRIRGKFDKEADEMHQAIRQEYALRIIGLIKNGKYSRPIFFKHQPSNYRPEDWETMYRDYFED